MNETLQHQLNHRSIRKFKDTPLTDEQLDLILSAASQTPTYTFLQAARASSASPTKPSKSASLRSVNNPTSPKQAISSSSSAT